jgi:transposase
MAKPLDVSADELKKLYIDQNKTIMDLALRYKVHYGTIIKYLRRYGLKKKRAGGQRQGRLTAYFSKEEEGQQ